MNANLTPVTLDLPDALIGTLTLEAQKKELPLEAWVTILVKKATSELPDNSAILSDSQDLSAAA